MHYKYFNCYLLCMSRELYGSIPDVAVPLMFTDYTTRKVLVMEWIEVFYWFLFAHQILARIVQCPYRPWINLGLINLLVFICTHFLNLVLI